MVINKFKLCFIWLNILIVIFICTLDLLTKDYMSAFLSTKEFNSNNYFVQINNFINLIEVRNYGMSFGLLSNIKYGKILILLLNIPILIYVFSMYNFTKNKIYIFQNFLLSMILGGGFGNIIDRILNDYVRDFIQIHYKLYYWPVFNVADISISISVCILIFLEIRKEFFSKQSKLIL